jgi:UDP-glucose 4-epimerase
MKKIAITGSGGFIGTHLLPYLVKSGYEVVEISRSKGYDISNWDSVKDISKCDILIHLAAKTFVPFSFENPREFYTINQLTTINAFELARIWSADVILMSSYFYGPPQYLPIDEGHPLNPHNPYAQTKFLAEIIAEGYCRDFKLNCIALRLFNIYGPNQDESFLIPTIYNQAKSGNIVLKDPRPKRDFIHINDVVLAVAMAINYKSEKMETFNLGSGVSYSVEEIVSVFQKAANNSCEVHYTREYRQGEVMDSVASIAKINKALGWEPTVSIEEGVASLFN